MAEVIHQVTITGPQTAMTSVLPVGSTSIGREATNALVLVHPLVSRRHALITCTEESCQITDLDSTHGTMVNRVRLSPGTAVPLSPGDVIEIGAFRLVYEQPPVVGTTPVARSPEAAVPRGRKPVTGPLSLASWQPAGAPQEEFPPVTAEPAVNGHYAVPPGLSLTESSYLEYLPDIYQGSQNRSIARFLALLESILAPIEWNVDNFDLYLDPDTAPEAFLPWLANWFAIAFDESWSEASQRELLAEAHKIYQRRGTVWALCRILEIYTGHAPEIDDQNKNLDPFTFTVRIPMPEQQVNRLVLEQLIDANKPAHTSYTLLFRE